MNIEINSDWLSFSIRRPVAGGEAVAAESARNYVRARFPELKIEHKSDYGKGRSPYQKSMRLGIGGMVFFGDSVPHMLIEISGRGCRYLEDNDLFYPVATRALALSINITRFDLAVDLETDLDPAEFIAERGERFKSVGTMESETGKTCYVGSPQARKRARVYRYYPPHDRAHLLRVEMVAKKGVAGDALRQYLDTGKREFAASWGNTFGWSHPAWDLSGGGKVRDWRPEAGDAGTLRWVREAVIPALERLYQDGEIHDKHALWSEIAENLPLEHRPGAAAH